MKKVKRQSRPVHPEQVRLQKFLSMAGVASRRASERLIAQGSVMVNGSKVREMGTKVDPKKDKITVDGKPVKVLDRKAYYLFFKPAGCVTTVRDEKDRTTVFHFLKGIKEKVFPVGRLDFNTEGLLLLTSDGDLAHALSHPSYKMDKTYMAKVRNIPTDGTLKRLERGITLDDGEKTLPLKAALVRTTGKNAWIRFKLREGKNRQVRRMCEKIGHPVSKLRRTGIGFLTATGLKPGECRHLDRKEVSRLKAALGLTGKKIPQKRKKF